MSFILSYFYIICNYLPFNITKGYVSCLHVGVDFKIALKCKAYSNNVYVFPLYIHDLNFYFGRTWFDLITTLEQRNISYIFKYVKYPWCARSCCTRSFQCSTGNEAVRNCCSFQIQNVPYSAAIPNLKNQQYCRVQWDQWVYFTSNKLRNFQCKQGVDVSVLCN